jgi:uncharacterized membrane protein
MTRRPDLATTAATVLAAIVAITTLAGIGLSFRPLLAAAFLLWVPGAAAVGFLRLTDQLLAAVLSIACSIAIGTLGAEMMVWTHLWHPRAATVVLACGCAIALLCQPPRLLRPEGQDDHTAEDTDGRTGR